MVISWLFMCPLGLGIRTQYAILLPHCPIKQHHSKPKQQLEEISGHVFDHMTLIFLHKEPPLTRQCDYCQTLFPCVLVNPESFYSDWLNTVPWKSGKFSELPLFLSQDIFCGFPLQGKAETATIGSC